MSSVSAARPFNYNKYICNNKLRSAVFCDGGSKYRFIPAPGYQWYKDAFLYRSQDRLQQMHHIRPGNLALQLFRTVNVNVINIKPRQ
jgi:hypothetical protein